ncbi:hypothetical protein EDD22DRAFT_917079 [Suillus occidentalis]|nr:hypothetical protein EDD22DRAFT_917079 [Suillus occidentalis]
MHPRMSCGLIVLSTTQTRSTPTRLSSMHIAGKDTFSIHPSFVMNRSSQDLLPPTDIQPVPMHVYNGLSAKAQSSARIFCQVLTATSLIDGLYTIAPLGQKLVASAQQSSCDELLQGLNGMKLDDFSLQDEDAERCDGCGNNWPAHELRTHIPYCLRHVAHAGLHA